MHDRSLPESPPGDIACCLRQAIGKRLQIERLTSVEPVRALETVSQETFQLRGQMGNAGIDLAPGGCISGQFGAFVAHVARGFELDRCFANVRTVRCKTDNYGQTVPMLRARDFDQARLRLVGIDVDPRQKQQELASSPGANPNVFRTKPLRRQFADLCVEPARRAIFGVMPFGQNRLQRGEIVQRRYLEPPAFGDAGLDFALDVEIAAGIDCIGAQMTTVDKRRNLDEIGKLIFDVGIGMTEACRDCPGRGCQSRSIAEQIDDRYGLRDLQAQVGAVAARPRYRFCGLCPAMAVGRSHDRGLQIDLQIIPKFCRSEGFS